MKSLKKMFVFFLMLSLIFQASVLDVSAPKAEAKSVEQGASLSTSNDLLQFSSKGHILGFKEDRMYMVGMGYALIEEFIGANRVKPISEDRKQGTGDKPTHWSCPCLEGYSILS